MDPRLPCGDVWVTGNYARDLTIAADVRHRDQRQRRALERRSTALLLGLIANNFVRVYHPTYIGNDNWERPQRRRLHSPT